jgi:hypothetical protein
MEIHPVKAEFFHADRRTQTTAFRKFFETAYKLRVCPMCASRMILRKATSPNETLTTQHP